MQETGNYSSNSRPTERLTSPIQNQIDKMRYPADEEADGRLHILKSRSQGLPTSVAPLCVCGPSYSPSPSPNFAAARLSDMLSAFELGSPNLSTSSSSCPVASR